MYTNLAYIFAFLFIQYFFCFHFNKQDFACLSILRSIPTIAILQTRAVEPADINGSGSPVGGMRPHTTSYCIIKLSFHF